MEQTINSLATVTGQSPYAIVAGAMGLLAFVLAFALSVFLDKRRKKRKEVVVSTRPTVPTFTPAFVKWVQQNFKSWNEFREFYRNVIAPNEDKLTREMWRKE